MLFVENGFEDRELMYPYYRFQEAGYRVDVVGPRAKAAYKGEYGLTIESNLSLEDINLADYEAIVIPGGRAPDRMRTNKTLVNLVREASKEGKVIAAICHGPQLLIEAGVVKGKKVTCYVSVATDVKNAGGVYMDKSVVVNGNLVTSRFLADLPDFCREILKLLEARK